MKTPTNLPVHPDDQRLTTVDVFPAVRHRQSVSDLLILGFFSLEVGEDIHGNALRIIMQHATETVLLINYNTYYRYLFFQSMWISSYYI